MKLMTFHFNFGTGFFHRKHIEAQILSEQWGHLVTRACFVKAAKRNRVGSRDGLGKWEANLELVYVAVIKQDSKNSGDIPELEQRKCNQPVWTIEYQQEKNDCNLF